MAIKNAKFGGTDLIDGEGPSHTDLNDTFNATIAASHAWESLYYSGDTSDTFIMVCTALIWQTNNRRTDDGGATWSASDLTDKTLCTTCDADNTYAISSSGAGAVRYTSDSWATINNASTDPPNCTSVIDISFPTTGVAILVGNASAGVGVWRSTDGGDNWAQASAAVDPVSCVDMFSATVGVLLTNDGSFWTTADAGDNWTDSTFNYGSAGEAFNVIMMSATTFLVADNVATTGTTIYKNSNLTGNGSQVMSVAANAVSNLSNFVETTNGNIYIVSQPGSGDLNAALMLRTEDNGDTWKLRNIMGGFAQAGSYPTTLQEYDTNKLIWMQRRGSIIKQDYDD